MYLSLGSNINRTENITQCLIQLGRHYGKIVSSPVYESEPVGFSGACFYNLVVSLQTSESLLQLAEKLKTIENMQGRVRGGERFSSRTLDIDILLYDALQGRHSGIELPRPEVYYNAFVLLPLVDIAPDLYDPKSGQTFLEIWQQKGPEICLKQKLWPVEFCWPSDVDLRMNSSTHQAL